MGEEAEQDAFFTSKTRKEVREHDKLYYQRTGMRLSVQEREIPASAHSRQIYISQGLRLYSGNRPYDREVKTCGIPEEILMQDKGFASRVVKAVIPDECIALRFVNKAYREVLTRAETLFWNVYEKNEFQMVDITQPCMEDTLPRIYMDLMPAKYYKKITIKDGETGLLYYDLRFEKRLGTGTYYFWNYGREVSCKIFNMKIQQLDISGQEILTADKVGVRLNVVMNYRITNRKSWWKRWTVWLRCSIPVPSSSSGSMWQIPPG